MSSPHKIKFWKENNLCSRCGQPNLDGKKMCEKHLLQSSDKERRKRLRRKSNALCIRCGKNPPRLDRTQCETCASDNREEYNANKMNVYYQRKSKSLCVRCGVKTIGHQAHCESCIKYMRDKDKKRYVDKKEKNLCAHCGSNEPIANEILCSQCKKKNQVRGLTNRRKNKANIIGHYGGICNCCGEKRMQFLTIDHIDGGGHKHRNSLKSDGTTFYRWIIKNGFPTGFQVLCLNCNMGRYLNGGICPHKDTN